MENNNTEKEPFLIKNSIITPDGTELISKSRHDYVSYKDKNGKYYAVDGGLDYLKRTYDEQDYTENSVYSDTPFELIRTSLHRGSYGKNGDIPLHYILLCDMTDEHLLATIEYEEKFRPNNKYLSFYKQELQYRNKLKKGMKRFIIGDIHGNLKALEQCLERSGFDNSKDQLICLGDYVDGHSESCEVVDFLIQLQKESNNRHIYLRGNHDQWCYEWLITTQRPNMWINQGGKATLESYIRCGKAHNEEHIKFFKYLHNYYIDGENRGFVHGGFTSRKGLGHEPYESNYYWDRDLWSIALLQHRDYQIPDFIDLESIRRYDKHKEIFIGHTSTMMWECKPHYPEWEVLKKKMPIDIPMNRCNMWNLDTGAGFYGKLTIMNVDTKEYWQSDYALELYPDYKGR